MRFAQFKIKNFRGITDLSIDLDSKPTSNVHCLVGLNESGKTTILEALNYFTYNETLDALDLKGYSIDDPNSLIPISRRANFSDRISIEVKLALDSKDESKLRDAVFKKTTFTLTSNIKSIVIEKRLLYKDSKYDSTNNYWTITLKGKMPGDKNPKQLTHTSNNDLWNKVVEAIKEHLPDIVYFPNFLFDFPSRIYLESSTQDQEKHLFYTQVIQDILDSLGNRTRVQEHIVKRIKSTEASDKASLDQLLLLLGRGVAENVIGRWASIFNPDQQSTKNIKVTHGGNAITQPYLEFKIEDTDGYYLIAERSLGFRWFFVFFLLTYYRSRRSANRNNILFLFDEPASNLHSTAQMQLLTTLQEIGEHSQIIYTTHSHHLINPTWLEATHIIKNDALHHGSVINTSSPSKTNIKSFKYREFASKYPDQFAYFKPILDTLDYQPSHLEMVPNVVMFEGKGDLYIATYFFETILEKTHIATLPGTGSGHLDACIELYIAWGKKFVVVLDDDEAGKKEKARYIEQFGPIMEGRTFTLQDIDKSFSDMEMEDLIDTADRMTLQNYAYPDDSSINKTHLMRAAQEAQIKKFTVACSDLTKERFEKLHTFILSKLI